MIRIDLYDIGVATGVGLVGAGRWLVIPALVLVAGGTGVIAVATLNARSRRRR
jgi:hypothetical protein